ncbi:MAG TPA: hypothetical protein DF614_08250 [Methylococcaceae bacterium]|nr:hypothetical protein [Methylococcaceae bacterium]
MQKYVFSVLLCLALPIKAQVICSATQMLNADKTGCVPLACPPPKQLNLTKTACFTPPTCTSPEVLNPTQTACIKPKALACTPPKILSASQISCIDPIISPTEQNTKPILGAVQQTWDVNVGELLRLPLCVTDAQRDEFKLKSTMLIGQFSEPYLNTDNLPTVDFLFTPTAQQGNKIYSTAFTARETRTTQHYTSNKVAIKIRVWPSANHDIDAITTLSVLRAFWENGHLILDGQMTFNTLLTQEERSAFITQQFELIISTQNAQLLHTTPLTLDNQGYWHVTFPLAHAQTPCNVMLEFNTHKVSHAVTNAPSTCQ